MKVSTLPPSRVLPALELTGWRVRRRILPLLLGSLVTATILQAQQPKPGDVTAPDKQTLQLLLQRIDQLEARVRQLEAERQPAPVVSPAPGPAQRSAPPVNEAEQQAESQAESAVPERMDLSKTLLRLRGFGDITLHGDTRKGNTTAFTLGQLNLFVTSDISEKFKFLSEIVFEGGPDNIYGVTRGEINTFSVDVERMVLQYSHNDYLNVAAGRFHTAIGYYNTAYHHSTWFQTTTGRPFLFEFEDKGGPLPIHNVGLSISGRIPSGGVGLHYVVEVGNGRASRSYVPPLGQSATAVQNYVDENAHKAFNVALFARPDRIRGLQVGFSAYRDVLQPGVPSRIGETILAAHAVFIGSDFEWLNEALVIRHTPQGGRMFNTPGWYTQISKRFGSYRPYFRYQYMNAADSEPVYPDIGLRAGPSVGVRYDPTDFVALKLQYDYTILRAQQAINGLALQAGFTF